MKNVLRFNENRRFKIIQFTDIHWHNGDTTDQKSAALMESITEAEAPDLIILTGDILSGGGCNDAVDSLRQVIEITERNSIPWGSSFR